MHTPLVIAHRGDPSTSLENSLESIRRALLLPVDMIEIDIRMSRDNEIYVMHDRTTGRTAKESIDIERATSEKISRIMLKNGESVPTLSEALTLVDGTCGLNLEIKSMGAGALTAQRILSSGYQGSVLVSSFKEEEVLAARRVMPGLPTALIFDVFTVRDVPRYKARGYQVISLRKKTVNEKLVVACHDQGILVHVWTVDEDDEMKMVIEWGVDGIYTNRPGVLKKIVNTECGVRNAE